MKIRITQVSRVERWIEIDIPADQLDAYLEGDFETPSSSDDRWEEHSELQNEEVQVLEETPYEVYERTGDERLRSVM